MYNNPYQASTRFAAVLWFSHPNIEPQTVAGGILIVQFRAQITLRRRDGFMAQAQLNLFERRFAVMRQSGESPAKIVRPDRRRVSLPAVSKRHAVNSLFAQSLFSDHELVQTPARAPADQPRRDARGRGPQINDRLHPGSDWNSPELVPLPANIHDAPSAFALLEMFDCERGTFGPAQACPDE
jgi:hypothetical protein